MFAVVLTFSFRKEICLFSFPEKIVCCCSYFLVFTLSFSEKFVCSFFYLLVLGSNMFVLVSIVPFPEKFILSPMSRKSRLMYSSMMGHEACVIFLSFSGGWKCSIFFICRWRVATFLDDSFKVFLFSRTFQMENDKNNRREHIDKKLDGSISQSALRHGKCFLTAIICSDNNGRSVYQFTPLIIRLQEFLFLFHFQIWK